MESRELFEELKKQGAMVVEVKQNGEIANYWTDEKANVMQLLGFLYNKTVTKANIKIRYRYNYSDSQTITFSQSYENYDGSKTVTSYTFYNVSTSLGYLDTYKIMKNLGE